MTWKELDWDKAAKVAAGVGGILFIILTPTEASASVRGGVLDARSFKVDEIRIVSFDSIRTSRAIRINDEISHAGRNYHVIGTAEA
jgi:hypothetical protein